MKCRKVIAFVPSSSLVMSSRGLDFVASRNSCCAHFSREIEVVQKHLEFRKAEHETIKRPQQEDRL
jgi:hypothetical protein